MVAKAKKSTSKKKKISSQNVFAKVRELSADLRLVVKLHTDGSYHPKENTGGYAAYNETTEEVTYGPMKFTTNNRAELRAMIEGLKTVDKGSTVEVISDSRYALGLVTNSTNVNANQDLHKELQSVIKKRKLNITGTWVKGHDGDPYNELVNEIANNAANQ